MVGILDLFYFLDGKGKGQETKIQIKELAIFSWQFAA
jgi:hypothetical protein